MVFSPYHSIVANRRLIPLKSPIVMGIVNLSDDSFYAHSRIDNETNLLKKVEKHVIEGALIIDIGAMSSRPGSNFISQEQETHLFQKYIPLLIKTFPNVIISIDTPRSEVARFCLDHGASIINDISAGTFDEKMVEVIAEFQVPYVMMHMQNNPANMQENPNYQNVTLEVLDFLIERVGHFRERGVHDLIVDPGFGFGKTIEHNYQLLNHLGDFRVLDCPILVGLSRKSMIYQPLDNSPEQALNGTTALHMLALINKANILRVHDVKEAIETIKLYQLVRENT